MCSASRWEWSVHASFMQPLWPVCDSAQTPHQLFANVLALYTSRHRSSTSSQSFLNRSMSSFFLIHQPSSQKTTLPRCSSPSNSGTALAMPLPDMLSVATRSYGSGQETTDATSLAGLGIYAELTCQSRVPHPLHPPTPSTLQLLSSPWKRCCSPMASVRPADSSRP